MNGHFQFDSKNWPLLTGHQAEKILHHQGEYWTTLGKRETSIYVDDSVTFTWKYPEKGDTKIEIPLNSLREINRKEQVYTVFPGGKFTQVSMFRGSYYQLVAPHPTSSFTLEIDGVHMHAVKDTTPVEATKEKVNHLQISEEEKILDICTGLGYSAIEEKRQGGEVLTIEKSKEVLRIAQINPFSEELEGTTIILGDAIQEITHFSDGEFDKIFHDPPRFSLAGELYSFDFYRELYRILESNGLLYHYTGNPGKHQNKGIVKGIMNRLRKAKFEVRRTARGVIGAPK